MPFKFSSVNEADSAPLSFPDKSRTAVMYAIDGEGVVVLGQRDIISNVVKVTISPTRQSQIDGIGSFTLAAFDQLLELEIDSENAADVELVNQELKSFCNEHLAAFFNPASGAFDHGGMVDYLANNKSFQLLSCAARDKAHQLKIWQHAYSTFPHILNAEQKNEVEAYHAKVSAVSNHRSIKIGHDGDAEVGHRALADVTVEVEEKNYSTVYQLSVVDIPRITLEVPKNLKKGGTLDVRSCYKLASGGVGSSRLGSITYDDVNSVDIQQILTSIKYALSVSVDGKGSEFFKRSPFVPMGASAYVSGFDEELGAQMSGAFKVTSPAKFSYVDQPVCFVLFALKDLGVIDVSVIAPDSRRQVKYLVSKDNRSMQITTIGLEAALAGKWSSKSPLQWIVPNGQVAAGNTSTLLKSLAASGIVDFEAHGGEASLRKKVIEHLSDVDKSKYVLSHVQFGSIARQNINVFERLPAETQNPKLMGEFSAYLVGRKISPSVVQRAIEQRVIRTSIDERGQDVICMVAETPDTLFPIVQKFVPSQDGSWVKLFGKGAGKSGAANTIRGANRKTIVLGEANIDNLAFLSALERAGYDLDEVETQSLMSAGYVAGWLSRNFGISFAEDGVCYLLNPVEKDCTESVHDELEQFYSSYEKVVFVSDGSPDSQKAFRLLEKTMSVGNFVGGFELVESANRHYSHKVDDAVLVVDQTNFLDMMSQAGIAEDQSGNLKYTLKDPVGEMVLVDSGDEAGLENARQRVVSKIGDATIVLAFDNDLAGHSKSQELYDLFKSIGVPVRPVLVPYCSKNQGGITHNQVLSAVNEGAEPLDVGFCTETQLNDFNDYLRAQIGSNALGAYFGRQFDGLVDADEQMRVGVTVSKYLQSQKESIKAKYPEVYSSASDLNRLAKDKKVNSKDFRAAVQQFLSTLSPLEGKPIHHSVVVGASSVKSATNLARQYAQRSAAPVTAQVRKGQNEHIKALASSLVQLSRTYSQVKAGTKEDVGRWVAERASLANQFKAALSELSGSARQSCLGQSIIEKALKVCESVDKNKGKKEAPPSSSPSPKP